MRSGDESGGVSGDVTGDVSGDLTGGRRGNVSGNVFGDLTGGRRYHLGTVIAASQGDPDSMSVLLLYYDRYIKKLSHKIVYNGDGNADSVIDESLRSYLIDVFIHTTMKFTFKYTD